MPPKTLRIALAQLNPVVGDVPGNQAKARAARWEAAALGADLVMLPELFLAGCPPRDLALRPAFHDACRRACEELARETADGGPAILIGLPWREGRVLYNGYALLDGGAIATVRFKVEHGLVDEGRAFEPGPLPGPVVVRGVRVGVLVGEDLWSEDVVECLAETGAEMLLIPSGSPYWRGMADERTNVAVARVAESGLPLVVLNQVGGQDELVFDGGSFVLNADSALVGQLPKFREALALTAWEKDEEGWRCTDAPREIADEGDEADYAACVLGLRDYVDKSGFPGVVLALTGGPDAALCAAMAVDALGASRVQGIGLTAPKTPEASLAAAAASAEALGIRLDVVPIAEAVRGVEATVRPLVQGRPSAGILDAIESCARTMILRSIANAAGSILLAGDTKSALSVGTANSSHDSGDFSPLKDLYRTEVDRLAALRNRWKPAWALGPSGAVIPEAVLFEELTDAEPDADRKGQEAPPPFEVLDSILVLLVEQNRRVADIVVKGHEPGTVAKVERLVSRAERKRRQAAPGVHLTRKSFERDRRCPIVNRFHDAGAPAFEPDPSLGPAVGRARSGVEDF